MFSPLVETLILVTDRQPSLCKQPLTTHPGIAVSDAPPILLYSFIEQTLQPGPAVSLKCSSAGNPTPQIAWTLDGFPLPSNGRYETAPNCMHRAEL
jgi:hypothetical protein